MEVCQLAVQLAACLAITSTASYCWFQPLVYQNQPRPSTMQTHDNLPPGASLPTANHTASHASPSSPTSRSRLDAPNSADTDGSTSMAAADPRYMPAGRQAGNQAGRLGAGYRQAVWPMGELHLCCQQ